MRSTKKHVLILLSMFIGVTLFTNCNGKGSTDSEKRGEPTLTHEAPIYDENTETFSLTVKADSVEDAKLNFLLMLGDSVLIQNEDGKFVGIQPFEEGYDIKMEAQWPDTVIERICHVMDFVKPIAPVEKISKEDLAKLIKAKDESLRTGANDRIVQGVNFHVTDSKMQPQMLPDAIVLIENGVWKGVEVVKLEYNETNQVTDITVRPVGEKSDVIDEDDEDYDY